MREFANPILASLGALTSQKLLPHRWLVESLIVPSEEFDLDQAPMEVPLISSLKLILDINPVLAKVFRGISDPSLVKEELAKLSYPWSHEDIRKEIYED